MGRATSGDLNRTSYGRVKYLYASISPRGRGHALGSTQSSIMPAPQQEPKGPFKYPDGPNPFLELGYISDEKVNELREKFDEHKGPDESIPFDAIEDALG